MFWKISQNSLYEGISLEHAYWSQETNWPRLSFLIKTKEMHQRYILAAFIAIHGFTISVPVLILPIFLQLLLRHGKFSNKSLFWIKHPSEQSMHTADDNNKVTSQTF